LSRYRIFDTINGRSKIGSTNRLIKIDSSSCSNSIEDNNKLNDNKKLTAI
jgi:hypothetical protein